jgi:anti-sigma regulatory factor (Ser/Thr protein kinase)/predicted transcriptional regulator
MDLRTRILKTIKKQKQLKASQIVAQTGYSRTYVHRYFRQLADEGIIGLVGKANQAHYVLTSKKGLGIKTIPLKGMSAASSHVRAKLSIDTAPLRVHKILQNRNLSEDTVLKEIKQTTAIFSRVADNVSSIVDYAFTEMLNNAIEHSGSEKIDVIMARTGTELQFHVMDRGIGIFNNIMKKKHLLGTMEAIQDLLKGKETTKPEAHSGEGIFFTSKIADILTIKSFEKKIVFDNTMDDIYIKDVKSIPGTKVDFFLQLRSKKKIADVFYKHTDESFDFSRTKVKVKLYHHDVDYVSRSQARRIVIGLEKFKSVELDFKDLKTIGQAFADEIFRIWQSHHKSIKLIPVNTNENVMFMITRAKT